MNEVRIATRRSSLALAQAGRVADLLRALDSEIEVNLVEVDTAGDRDQVGSIAALTELGAFVRAVQRAVLDDRADLAVHSLKDLPVAGPEDLAPPVFPERASPFDVLVGSTIDGLRPGALIGTGSPRRAAQILELRPDLRTTELRGNVDTRLRKVASGAADAAVLAEAGLQRLDKADLIAQRLTVSEMVPAPGQGALAVEARAGSRGADLAAGLDDTRLRTLLDAERDLLADTGAGCRSALGALATWDSGRIRFDAFVADDRGPRRATVHGASPDEVVSEARKELGL
ncbi:MAG: hydroxymethylbilane synthase [Acidimicrobiia bacterium]